MGRFVTDYLTEIERQRYTCNNIPGKINGIIKDCGTRIVESLVERLEKHGDASYLKNQNLKLREDLAEARRKIDRQDKEILELRQSMVRLERLVHSLKEGGGPYARRQCFAESREPQKIPR